MQINVDDLIDARCLFYQVMAVEVCSYRVWLKTCLICLGREQEKVYEQ